MPVEPLTQLPRKESGASLLLQWSLFGVGLVMLIFGQSSVAGSWSWVPLVLALMISERRWRRGT